MIDPELRVIDELPSDSEVAEAFDAAKRDIETVFTTRIRELVAAKQVELRTHLTDRGYDKTPELSAVADKAIQALLELDAQVTFDNEGMQVEFLPPDSAQLELAAAEFGSQNAPQGNLLQVLMNKLTELAPDIQQEIERKFDESMVRFGLDGDGDA
ncbi:MAG: hypothetical protein E6R03_04235 [Hyphomicrobiaceae bacterium]|nr:MAG: hypothetical protein E6R03_04235 [Hyphomicrobiaceae bacterium]